MTDAAFISVGDLGEGFAHGSDTLRPSTELDGRTLHLTFPSGPLTVSLAGDTATIDDEQVTARITSIRSGLVLIDGLTGTRPPTSTTLVVDLDSGAATRVLARLPRPEDATISALERVRRGEEPTLVAADVEHGRIDGTDGQLHAPTDELVGMRNLYRYSPTEAYEHIYLGPARYTWHCRAGVEHGLADTDACSSYRIREGLVLFVWREKIVPTLGLLLIDLEQLRTDGKILGQADLDLQGAVNFPVGSRFEILNVTELGPAG